MRAEAGWLLTLGVAGCSLTMPLPGSYSCDANGICLDGFVCNAQRLCVASGSGSTGSTGGGSSGSSTSVAGSSSGSMGSRTTSGTSAGSSRGSTGSVTTASGSTSGSSSGGIAPGNFAGDWDMSFSHVSLTQDGGVVAGKYRDWGYTYLDPSQAGTISGTVQGNVFQGTFEDNALDAAVPLTWTLSSGQLSGTYQYAGKPPYPWCGVAAGQGTPLPAGCGWSDGFPNNAQAGTLVTLQQVADEVTGSYYAGKISGGVVSDFSLNGQFTNSRTGYVGRFSFWMTPDGTQFSGNFYNGANQAWCGYRGGTPGPLPTQCLGGGGYYDGTWFTNLGTLTLVQPEPSNSPVTGIWFGWGSDTEYTVVGLVTGPVVGPPTAYALIWSDNSPLGGAVAVSSRPSDTVGVTLQGQAAVDGGGLWCGVNYGPNPFATVPDGGQIGTLYEGCGLTSSQWSLWQPSAGDPDPPPSTGQLAQTRGSVTGFTDTPFDVATVTGSVAFSPPSDGGLGSWTVVTGSWTNGPDAGRFTWYPDSQDHTFAGDFTVAGSLDAGAWCGSATALSPVPCLE